MATVQHSSTYPRRGALQTTWSSLGNGDDGTWEAAARWADKSVSVSGTFGAGGTLVIEGPNSGQTLTDVAGTTLSITAAGTYQITENPWQMRPRVTAGDGTTDLTVEIIGIHS